MSSGPLLSYIVLSYNYERYIGKTLQSILAQTVQDFEIVVVDDKSKDRSVEIVSAMADPRIRLFKNESNLGGAASYNKAILQARGEWLVNLDADDWIDPRKAEIQLQLANDDPRLDIIGTYISVYDEHDAPHSSASSVEALVNQPHDLNLVDTWIGANHLCRSSTMVKASAHRRIGLDDAAMVRAPDYELWTRALKAGCRFAVVPEKLTSIRLHYGGVTHADPSGTLLEMSFAMLRNLMPLAEARSLYPSMSRIIAWVGRHPALSRLLPEESHRLLGMLMQSTSVRDFSDFVVLLANAAEHPELGPIGRRSLSFISPYADGNQDARKLHQDINAYTQARNFWRTESEKWEGHYRDAVVLHQESHAQSETWERQYRALEKSVHQQRSGWRALPGKLWSRVRRNAKK
ncbi:MAG: glycosyltransferase [Variovorax sp.]